MGLLMEGRGKVLKPKGKPLPSREKSFWKPSPELRKKIKRLRELANRPISQIK